MATVGFARYVDEFADPPLKHEIVEDLGSFEFDAEATGRFLRFFEACQKHNVTMRFWSTGSPEKGEPDFLIFIY